MMRAALLALAAAFLFNLEAVAAKALEGVPLATLVLVRALGQLLWIMPAFLRDPAGTVRTNRLGLALLRGVLSAASWFLYFATFTLLPLATATVLSFSSVLFVIALSGPVLRERVGWRRWAAALVGFAGVVVILRPDALPMGWPVAAALSSAFMSAIIMLTTKTLARSERTETIMLWIGVVTASFSFPLALPGLAWPGWANAGLLSLAGLSGPAAMHLWISALRLADASAIAPLSYVRLVFAAGAGVLLFQEVPDIWLALGAALIIGSAIYVTRARPPGERTASSTAGSRPKSR